MDCPRDGTKLEAKVYEANIEVDSCGTCQGMFLDKGELEQIQKAAEHDYSKALKKDFDPMHETFAAANQELAGTVKCPKCGAEMDMRPYGYGSQVLIDVCPEDCGIWLDAGEIQALEQFFERSQASVSIPITWRIWATLLGTFKRKK
jgi:Zn-finger nucleic acid-binding protein